jgi:hypothetical protein
MPTSAELPCTALYFELSGALPAGPTIAALSRTQHFTLRQSIIYASSTRRNSRGKETMLGERSTNLMYHRANGSVWDKRGWSGPTVEERLLPWVIGAAGAAAITYGASRRSWRGLACAMGGLTLWTCATSGLCNPKYASARLDHLMRQRHKDVVTTQSMHSFPASDPPSFTSAASTPNEHERMTRPVAQLVHA